MNARTAVLLFTMSLAGCADLPSHYHAERQVGYVVDADSKQPISGAIVVYEWQLEGGLEAHTFDLFHVEEAATDEDGRYEIPAWGPLPRPAKGDLNDSDPEIFVFKSGYMPRNLTDGTPIPGARPANSFQELSRRQDPARNSRWRGHAIPLRKLIGEPKDYANDMRTPIYTGTFYLFDNRGTCWWKRTPKLVKALDAEMKRQEQAGATRAHSLMLEGRLTQKQCQPFDEFLKQYREIDNAPVPRGSAHE